jgi:hypothetical protein
MLTRLRVNNFKTLNHLDVPRGSNVVFVGPNNSGKTSALQALSLWQSGIRAWAARRPSSSKAKIRQGVTLNRQSLTHTPVAGARLLWHDLRVNEVRQDSSGQKTRYIFLDIIVDGEDSGKSWSCGLEFYYANPESVYCRPIRLTEEKEPARMSVPSEASKLSVAMLPPMSGLTAEEPEWQPGRIDVLLGEGQTAQVLRNMCFQV